MKILIISSEVFPFAKTGGLANLAGFLPQALKKLGHDVRVFTPKYKVTDEKAFALSTKVEHLEVQISNRYEACSVLEGSLGDGAVPVYFLKNDAYYRRDHLYGDSQGDYPDNAERFIYFSRSVPEVCKALGFIPDVLHCCDWQSGLVPVYLDKFYRQDPLLAESASIFTIYNLSHQGLFWHYDMHLTGLGWDLFTPDGLEYYGKINLMKGGLLWADVLTTVSPSYREEIQRKEFGNGLEGVLQYRIDDLYGVLNGVDYSVWNPESDPLIPQNYSLKDLKGKQTCRKALLQDFALEDELDRPVVAMISHLDAQKGAELVAESIEKIMALDLSLILMGTGQEKFHRLFQHIREKYRQKMGLRLEYNSGLQHKILAGADMLLMPSLYEPTGSYQIYSLKYGTIPLVHAVGSLKDSVKNFDPASDAAAGTGLCFHDPTPEALVDTIQRALTAYQDRKSWKALQIRAMQEDFSWKVTAGEYEKLYNKALEKRSE